MVYELEDMSDSQAKQVLRALISELGDMEVEDLTTFELSILHRVVKNPPNKHQGAEWPKEY